MRERIAAGAALTLIRPLGVVHGELRREYRDVGRRHAEHPSEVPNGLERRVRRRVTHSRRLVVGGLAAASARRLVVPVTPVHHAGGERFRGHRLQAGTTVEAGQQTEARAVEIDPGGFRSRGQRHCSPVQPDLLAGEGRGVHPRAVELKARKFHPGLDESVRLELFGGDGGRIEARMRDQRERDDHPREQRHDAEDRQQDKSTGRDRAAPGTAARQAKASAAAVPAQRASPAPVGWPAAAASGPGTCRRST